MKRLFAAIKILPDHDFIRVFRKIKNHLSHESIKWVEEDNMHITLKFFGETPEGIVSKITAVLEKIGREEASFTCLLRELGVFGSFYKPRVLWVGVEPIEPVLPLMQKIQTHTKHLGYPIDRQNLRPHLTLGRIKTVADRVLFQKIIESNNGISTKPFEINHIILFESILLKDGPKYIPLQIFPLKKPLV